MSVVLGSHPQFPVSEKRGMARAIECVEWLKAFAEARAEESDSAPMLKEIWRGQAMSYETVLNTLRKER